ncbi:MAG: Hsp20 family protein [Candidatus Izimaplasma sp.]|nr:Hsp20 family protein [Candidatus Izimaplasma bacterium]
MFKLTPYGTKRDLNRDVYEVFDDFFSSNYRSGSSFRVDVKELENDYVVNAELPGIDKNDVSVKYENERLIIKVETEQKVEDEKEDPKEKYLHREIKKFSSERSIYLEDVNPNKLTAKMNNGILSVILPKTEEKMNSFLVDID